MENIIIDRMLIKRRNNKLFCYYSDDVFTAEFKEEAFLDFVAELETFGYELEPEDLPNAFDSFSEVYGCVLYVEWKKRIGFNGWRFRKNHAVIMNKSTIIGSNFGLNER